MITDEANGLSFEKKNKLKTKLQVALTADKDKDYFPDADWAL